MATTVRMKTRMRRKVVTAIVRVIMMRRTTVKPRVKVGTKERENRVSDKPRYIYVKS